MRIVVGRLKDEGHEGGGIYFKVLGWISHGINIAVDRITQHFLISLALWVRKDSSWVRLFNV